MAHYKALVPLVFSAVGIILGLSASATFLYFYNISAAVWALVSAVIAGVNCLLLYLYVVNKLELWYTRKNLDDLQILGVLAITLGGTCMIWYIFEYIYYELPILPVSTSVPIIAVWAFMTFKWGVSLFFTTRYLMRWMPDQPPLLSVT